MLVLSLKVGQSFLIGDDIRVTVNEVRGQVVRFGIEAPRDVLVLRSQLDPKTQERTYLPHHRTKEEIAQQEEAQRAEAAAKRMETLHAMWDEMTILHRKDAHCQVCRMELHLLMTTHRRERDDAAVLALPGVLTCPACAGKLRGIDGPTQLGCYVANREARKREEFDRELTELRKLHAADPRCCDCRQEVKIPVIAWDRFYSDKLAVLVEPGVMTCRFCAKKRKDGDVRYLRPSEPESTILQFLKAKRLAAKAGRHHIAAKSCECHTDAAPCQCAADDLPTAGELARSF